MQRLICGNIYIVLLMESMTHPEPSETHLSTALSISCLDMFSSGSISLSLVMVLALPLKNAVL